MTSAAYPASAELAELVRRGQAEAKLTNPQIARALGMGERTWARIKEGERGLQNIGEVLTLVRLFGWPEDAFDRADDTSVDLSAPGAGAAVMDELRRINQSIEDLRALVERMAADTAAAKVVAEALPMADAIRAAAAADKAAIEAREGSRGDAER